MINEIYDIAGIGIGPFNLGLAALLAPLEYTSSLFFDRNKTFAWHPGMMIPGTTLQVPFYADLVTLADPTSRFNFFSFLKAKNRIIRFGIYDNNYISRKLFNEYCNWVADQLDNLCFDHCVEAVRYNKGKRCYEIHFVNGNKRGKIYAAHIVCGVGSEPCVPGFAQEIKGENVLHSSAYLFHKKNLLEKESIAIVGSGQSAAEIFCDLLQHVPEKMPGGISWITRSDHFFPMDYSKLSLEMTSPDYIKYFYHLPAHKKGTVLHGQNSLYKGINSSLIDRIYERLYGLYEEMGQVPVKLMPNMELQRITSKGGNYRLHFMQTEQEKFFEQTADAVVLATGYQPASYRFFEPVKDRIQWQENGKFDVNLNYTIDKKGSEIFVQNAELHTHGFNTPDLGMGPHRNAVIINTIAGYEHYTTEKDVTFQEFGV